MADDHGFRAAWAGRSSNEGDRSFNTSFTGNILQGIHGLI